MRVNNFKSYFVSIVLSAYCLSANADKPSAPLHALASASKTKVTVTWVSPLNDGGLPIKRYTVISNPDSKTCSVSGKNTKCVFGNLKQGKAYTFKVAAKNKDGLGEYSDSTNPVVPSKKAVSAQCGTANNIYVSYQPSAPDLCLSGVAGPVKSSSGVYSWQCAGFGGGSNENCKTGPYPTPEIPRDMTKDEIEFFSDLIVRTIPSYLKSPSSFKMIDSPRWYWNKDGNPFYGWFLVDFDSQNGFGAMIRSTAVCTMQWMTTGSGYWTSDLTYSLRLCSFTS